MVDDKLAKKAGSVKDAGTVKESSGFYDVPERYELIDGKRYDFLSSPRISHQVLVNQLCIMLDASCRAAGIVITAPLDVHFDEDNMVQPDLVYIANETMSIIQGEAVRGAPDLLAEVLSPNTGRRDKQLKKELYARFGVREYWIVDPVYLTIDQFVLDGGRYRLEMTHFDTGALTTSRFPCIRIDLERLFGSIARFRQEE